MSLKPNFVQRHEIIKCSKCNSINNYKNITKGKEIFIKCNSCNHKSSISVLYTTETEPITYTIYPLPSSDSKLETFTF